MAIRRTIRYAATFILGMATGMALLAWLLIQYTAGQPKYRINDHGQAMERAILAHVKPCYRHTGGYNHISPCRDINTVPVPATLSLMLIGAGGLLMTVRRTRQ